RLRFRARGAFTRGLRNRAHQLPGRHPARFAEGGGGDPGLTRCFSLTEESPLVCVLDTGEGQARLPAASGGQGGFGRALTDSDDLFDVLERLDAELRHGHPDAQVGWMKAGVDVD